MHVVDLRVPDSLWMLIPALPWPNVDVPAAAAEDDVDLNVAIVRPSCWWAFARS